MSAREVYRSFAGFLGLSFVGLFLCGASFAIFDIKVPPVVVLVSVLVVSLLIAVKDASRAILMFWGSVIVGLGGFFLFGVVFVVVGVDDQYIMISLLLVCAVAGAILGAVLWRR